ncbi:MAG: class I SAM-dependent methyltransferase, partial [Rhodospirillales bacterium]
AQTGADAAEFQNLSIYPIRYAEDAIRTCCGKILEIGCGPGRIVRHYAGQNYDITGLERSVVAVNEVRKKDPNLRIDQGDALSLPYADGAFDLVMAFGVYHNIENGFEIGLSEASRVLKQGGRFVISMRPDNLEMWLNEAYWRWRNFGRPRDIFHKWLVNAPEFTNMLNSVGLRTTRVDFARNMSFLYRFPFFRRFGNREAERRARGYELNRFGTFVDSWLKRVAPAQFCNVLVFSGTKQ